ncbi:hypothetical protein ACSBR2_042337 [Camellia fascicularis]
MDNFNADGDYDNDENVTGSSQQPNHPYRNPYLMAARLTMNYKVGKKVGVQQEVAIFLFIVGQYANNRNAQEIFQLLGKTISKYFHSILKACENVCGLGAAVAKKWGPSVHKE